VLEAVKNDPLALRWADQSCKCDKDIILQAVQLSGESLRSADDQMKNDRDIVLAAVRQNSLALMWAGDEVLEDESFAVEARQNFHILRIAMMSGRRTYIAVPTNGLGWGVPVVAALCCERLKLSCDYTDVRLLHGTEVVPKHALPSAPPFIGRPGTVTELQLVLPSGNVTEP